MKRKHFTPYEEILLFNQQLSPLPAHVPPEGLESLQAKWILEFHLWLITKIARPCSHFLDIETALSSDKRIQNYGNL